MKRAIASLICFLLIGLACSTLITTPIPPDVLKGYPSIIRQGYQFHGRGLSDPESFLLQYKALTALKSIEGLPPRDGVCTLLQGAIETIDEITNIPRFNALIELIGLYRCDAIRLSTVQIAHIEDLLSSDALVEVHSGVKAVCILAQTSTAFPHALTRYDFVDVLDLVTSLFLPDGTTRASVSVLSPSFQSTTLAFDILATILSSSTQLDEATKSQFQPYILQYKTQLKAVSEQHIQNLSASIADYALLVTSLNTITSSATTHLFPFNFTRISNVLSTTYASSKFDVVSNIALITTQLNDVSNRLSTPLAITLPQHVQLSTTTTKAGSENQPQQLPLHITTILGDAIPSQLTGNVTISMASTRSGSSPSLTKSYPLSSSPITIPLPSNIGAGQYSLTIDISPEKTSTQSIQATQYQRRIALLDHPQSSTNRRTVYVPSSSGYIKPQLSFTTSDPATVLTPSQTAPVSVDVATTQELLLSLPTTSSQLANVRLVPCPTGVLKVDACARQVTELLQGNTATLLHPEVYAYFPLKSAKKSMAQLSLYSNHFSSAYFTNPLMILAVDTTGVQSDQLTTTSTYHVGFIQFINSNPDRIKLEQYTTIQTKFPDHREHTFEKTHGLPHPVLPLLFTVIILTIFVGVLFLVFSTLKPQWDTTMVGGKGLAMLFTLALTAVVVVLLQYWLQFNLFQIMSPLAVVLVLFLFIAHRVLSASARHMSLATQMHVTEEPPTNQKKKAD